MLRLSRRTQLFGAFTTGALASRAVSIPLVLGASMAFAQAGTNNLDSAPVEELKQVYLACDRMASRQVMDLASAAHCSSVGEALQTRAFEGNFDQLLAWWRVEKHVASGQPSAGTRASESR